MNQPSSLAAPPTSRVMDITGPENTLILLAVPGDEVTTCGGLIAEACARGRPPFVAILGDGAEDGAASLARARETASRRACRLLGLPEGRLLFVGLRQRHFPAPATPVFAALRAALAQVSWRHDCNVILAPFATLEDQSGPDAAAAWHLAATIAAEIRLPLLAAFRTPPPAGFTAARVWRLHAPQWNGRKAEAARAHGAHLPGAGDELYGRAA